MRTLDVAAFHLPHARREHRLLQELVRSGDLVPAVVDALPTFTLHGASIDWRPEDGMMQPLWPDSLNCPQDYRCLLGFESQACP